MPTLHNANELTAWREQVRRRIDPEQTQISVCTGTGCASSGSNKVVHCLREALAADGREQMVTVKATGCHGCCEQGPLV
ncbi:MAG: (2Fe-2S) ferredoxin domain-containing protein, partial [Verrucomicrobia bacterium]|nr:(2Fe-2S) ferredoxin domain-containing protein [Verrucomicrobiota bacterium]